MITSFLMLINKIDENNAIMKFFTWYYLFEYIYFNSLMVYFSIISAKAIDKLLAKHINKKVSYRYRQNSKHITF